MTNRHSSSKGIKMTVAVIAALVLLAAITLFCTIVQMRLMDYIRMTGWKAVKWPLVTLTVGNLFIAILGWATCVAVTIVWALIYRGWALGGVAAIITIIAIVFIFCFGVDSHDTFNTLKKEKRPMDFEALVEEATHS